MSRTTTVIIVNWNGERFLPNLMDSVLREQPAHVIVVDNSSSDRSVELLRNYEGVQLICNSANVGFGVAANQGIAEVSTPYALLLNVDVELLSGSIQTLESFLRKEERAAVAAPQLLFPDGRLQTSCRSFPTILKKFLFISYLDHLIPSGYRLAPDEHIETREVDQPMGAALMFRKVALDQAGHFDPEFFMYMEEVDLCYRIKRLGWKIYYVPDAKVVHHAGGSSSQAWERSQTDYFRSVVRYFRKRGSHFRLLLLKLALSAAVLIRALLLAMMGRMKHALFYVKISPRILQMR